MADDQKSKSGRRSARGRRARKLDEDSKVAVSDEGSAPAAASAASTTAVEEATEKKPRRSRSKKKEEVSEDIEEAPAKEKAEKKPRRTRSKKKDEVSEGAEDTAAQGAPAQKDDEEKEAKKAKKASSKKSSKKDEDESAPKKSKKSSKKDEDESAPKKSKKSSKKDEDESAPKKSKKSQKKDSDDEELADDDAQKERKKEAKKPKKASKKDEETSEKKAPKKSAKKSKKEAAPSEEPTASRRGQVQDPVIARGESWLRELFEKMQLDLTATGSFDGDNYIFNVSGADTEVMIGRSKRSPRVLTGMQTLLAESLGREARSQVVIDIGGFKQQRQSHLSHVGARLGEAAKKVGHPILVAGLSAFDRRVIHKRIGDMEGVNSESTDHGIFRKLKIDPS
ncbi:hypothetical protein DL240_13960 [Lujinxingia litoralis]|uniref:R3H domain-containing protein n=1 Tax=Lujinxingia litoralis TaxID=2211119 RepID=A0A328C5P0_9DELT|nr:hypothetical protein [Lujinxingia litoralis]RAL21232.1 hypothetical protein DL240_13960 [Lujinxingia litoralis]